MFRRYTAWLLLLPVFCCLALPAQSIRKERKRFLTHDTAFRKRIQKMVDSMQQVKALEGDSSTVKEITLTAEPALEQKKETDNGWLLPVAGLAIAGAVYFLYRRRK